jgi:hypothetical protein
MARDFKNYDVFISSPSDVAQERDVVQEAIEQINRSSGCKEGFRLNPIRWEIDVSSQIGSHPQKIINEQIGDEYDIFVGILCNRFGQKTESYESGTEEEFHRAYERYDSTKKTPEILFYFKDPRKSEYPIDAEHLLKVSEFKKMLGGLGIYESFDSSDSLKTKVVAALVKALDRLRKSVPENSDSHDVGEKPLSPPSDNAVINVSDFDEDIGIMDLTEMVFSAVEIFNDNLEIINAATEKLSERMVSRTEELRKLQPTGETRKDQKNAKAIVEKVAAEMQRYCHTLDQSIPNVKREFSSALRCMEHAVIISHQDGIIDQNEIKNLIDELESLNSILSNVHRQISDFRDAVSVSPRMTSKFNQAKRRTVSSINEFLEFISEASVSIDVTLKSVTK